MGAAIAGIFSHAMTSAQALTGASPTPTADSSATSDPASTSSTDASSATISANDFLTLLVTEMQNQDPTATTDPNEYINQLVNVNSLEQLIDINQNLSTALGSSTPSAGTGAVTQSAGTASALTTSNASGTTARANSASPLRASAAPQTLPGNLSIPSANPSAGTVASALGGQAQVARSRSGSIATVLPATH